MKETEYCRDDTGEGGVCFLYHEGLCMYGKKPKRISHMKYCPLEKA